MVQTTTLTKEALRLIEDFRIPLLVVADLLKLDVSGQLAVGTLLEALAAGSQAVERWLREHEAS